MNTSYDIFSGVETLDMANWGNRNGRSKGENLVNYIGMLCVPVNALRFWCLNNLKTFLFGDCFVESELPTTGLSNLHIHWLTKSKRTSG